MTDPTNGTGNQSPGEEINKENINSLAKLKAPNRRDSLAKGILKNIAHNEENNTVHVMQLPLRDSQQPDGSFAGKKSYRRRVSFAPEVTLHKIDLVPQVSGPEPPQPRRRETIAVVPSSSQESITYSSQVSERSAEADDEADEILYDSSDVEMEDDSHVYSSPGKRKGPGFQIHQDQNEEYTETIDMSISRVLDDDEDSTMNLTKPLSSIQDIESQQQSLIEEPLPLSSRPQEEEPSNRPFGSIKSLFSDDAEEEEVEMDLTQPFPSSQHLVPTQPLSQEPISTQSFSSQVSELSSQENFLPDQSSSQGIPTQLLPEEANESVDQSVEETMELTALAEGTTDKITLQNTLHNRQLKDVENEVTMEQTKALGSIRQVNVDEDVEESLTQSINEITMDETRMYSNKDENDAPVKNVFKVTTPLKANRSHTSETGSPMSSKRKNIQTSEALTNDLRDKINSLTPRKRRRSSPRKSLVVDAPTTSFQSVVSAPFVPFEPVSSVLSSQTDSQVEPRSTFTPLRSAKNTNRKSIIAGAKPEFGSLIEKAPLAPSHEQDEDESDGYQPVSLKRFLNDLSIEFFDDLNVNDDFTIEIKLLQDGTEIKPVDFTIAKFSKIPWLELYSFSCDELQNNMNELRQLFDNLDLEFAEENPQLVRDYYETKSLSQQKKMSDRLLLMKTYSDKEAEKAWYSWHDKLLDELLKRLETNAEILTADFKSASAELAEVTEVENVLKEENGELVTQLEIAKFKKESIESEDFEEIIRLRQELMSGLESLAAEQERFKILETEVSNLSSQIIDTSALEQEIKEKTVFVERNSEEPSLRLNALLESFSREQLVTGIQFNKLVGDSLSVTLTDSNIKVNISLSDPSNREIIVPVNLPEFTHRFLQRYLAKNSDKELVELLSDLRKLSLSLNSVHNSLFYLGLVNPSKVDVTEGITVEILEFNKSEKYKVKIELKLDENELFNSEKATTVEARLVYGPESLNEERLLRNLKSKFSKNTLITNIEQITLIRN